MIGLGTAVLGASLALFGAPSPEPVEGVITEMALAASPRTIRVKTKGGDVLAEIKDRTLVVFEGRAARHSAAAEVSSLSPGMTVRIAFDEQGVARIHVLDLPGRARGEAADDEPTPRAVRTVKARLHDLRYDVRRRRGELKADVAGRRETFRSSDPALFRGFRRGDLVLLGVAADGSLVSIQSARLVGRVMRVDVRRREVTVELGGRPEDFGVAKDSLLDRMRAGDVLHFDVEERSGGRRVITAVY